MCVLDLRRGCIAAMVAALGMALMPLGRAQCVSGGYEPSGFDSPPRDPEFVNPVSADGSPCPIEKPTPFQQQRLNNMVAAMEVYCLYHPEFISQLGAFRDAVGSGGKGTVRITCPHKSGGWITCPNLICWQVGPPASSVATWWRWQVPLPGGGGGGGDGQSRRPNLILTDPRELALCDPNHADPGTACFRAANAIITIVQEGGRMLQSGSVTWEGASMVPDCEMILSALDTYRKTLAVIDDLLANGVPLAPNGHCALQARYVKTIKLLADDFKRHQDALCAWAILLHCNPVPTECL